MIQLVFKEMAFNAENVRKWAEQQIEQTPKIKAQKWDEERGQHETIEIDNTVEHELRTVLGNHYAWNLCQYKKWELIEECLSYIQDGISKPLCDMSADELLGDITGEVTEIETMGDFIQHSIVAG